MMYKTPTFAEPQQYNTGADPGFQVRGGALKKIAPSGGRRKFVWVFRVKNHEFTPKNHIFSNFRGGAPPPWIRPCNRHFSMGQLWAFIIQLVLWDLLPRSEWKVQGRTQVKYLIGRSFSTNFWILKIVTDLHSNYTFILRN
jgi:hypothetical protein